MPQVRRRLNQSKTVSNSGRDYLPHTMLDDLAARHIRDLFADVGRVVGDALEMLYDIEPSRSPAYNSRLAAHTHDDLVVALIIKAVYLVIAFNDGSSLVRFSLDECIQRVD